MATPSSSRNGLIARWLGPAFASFQALGFSAQPSRADRAAIVRHIAAFKTTPKIAIVMEGASPEAMASVQAQLYPEWELWLVSGDRLKEDARIKHAKTIKSAVAECSADYVAFMSPEDRLHVTALYEVAAAINANPKARIIYTDEDKAAAADARYVSYHKPGFNIELLLGWNFVGNLCVYEARLLRKLGPSDPHDLILRAARAVKVQDIIHIPIVLYSRRISGDASASHRAIQHYLKAEGEGARAVPAGEKEQAFFSRVIRKVPKPEPKVSLIIPTKDLAPVLKVCVDTILEKTAYKNYEIIIVDNNSSAPDALALLADYAKHPKITVLHYPKPFNYAAINNAAAKIGKGNLLALLNNDVEIVEPGWLSEMVSIAVRKEIGAVGAKLLFPTGQIQHGGVFLGPKANAAHMHFLLAGDEPGYFNEALLTRAASAVTGACLVVSKKKFIEVGGLDETHLPVTYNDVDFCLKLVEAGYRNVWTPFARLIHHESMSRGPDVTPEKKARLQRERAYFEKRWNHLAAFDAFHNPNLSLVQGKFKLVRNRRPKSWAAYL